MVRESLLILGSTGSIGRSTLDVISLHPSRFEVYGLVAGKNIELLFEQAVKFKPKVILISDEEALARWYTEGFDERLKAAGPAIQLLGQSDLLCLCASDDVDTVMASIVGSAGLQPTLASLRAGKKVLLANKESLVLAGRFMLEASGLHGGQIVPVDSEHNAIYQCLPAGYIAGQFLKYGIHKLILTASGGPFRTTPLAELEDVTPKQAIAHPNWSMGPKISVDSATMANKGLELIEAYWLFGVPPERLSVVIHPQSIVHSLVEYVDSSVLAQMGCPDMRTPIAHALSCPERLSSGSKRLCLTELGRLDFEAPDFARFPMLKLAFQTLENPSVLAPLFNAANEVAVQAFLDYELPFNNIYQVVDSLMDRLISRKVTCLEDAMELDFEARVTATEIIKESR